MQVNFYKTESPNNAVSKVLTDQVTLTDCNFISENNKKTPMFRVNSTTDLTTYNYVYISAYGRYYFASVRNISVNCYMVECTCDLLYTYASDIKDLTCTIKRSAVYGSSYMYDEYYHSQVYKMYVTKQFPQGLTDCSYILMTVGNTSTP